MRAVYVCQSPSFKGDPRACSINIIAGSEIKIKILTTDNRIKSLTLDSGHGRYRYRYITARNFPTPERPIHKVLYNSQPRRRSGRIMLLYRWRVVLPLKTQRHLGLYVVIILYIRGPPLEGEDLD